MRNKKGDMTIGTLITIIVLLIGFAIVLYFIYQILFNQQVDREACHQSIIFRATLPAFGGISEAVNLKCKTEKICITSGLIGGSCPDFSGSSGITKVRVSNIEDIERTIAQSIADCWSMTGEGKVDLFSQWIATNYGFGSVYPSCIICTRIAFDSVSLNKTGLTPQKLQTMNVNQYMLTHAMPNKQISYYEFMVGKSPAIVNVKPNLLGSAGGSASTEPARTGAPGCDSECITKGYSGGRSIGACTGANTDCDSSKSETCESFGTDNCCCAPLAVDQTFNSIKTKIDPNDLDAWSNDPSLQTKELAIMFMQISAPSHGESAANIGKLLLGAATGSMVTAPSATISGVKAVSKLCTSNGYAAAICAGVVVLAGVYQQGSVAHNRAVTAGYCSDVIDKDKARDGCSVVRTVNYDVEDIKQSCAVIESIS
jgi:hypothetical protein